MVGMSKSGSRYGRRSNWFKIHCLLQEQSHQAQARLKDPKSPFEKVLSSLDAANNNNSNNGNNTASGLSNPVTGNAGYQGRLPKLDDPRLRPQDLASLRSQQDSPRPQLVTRPLDLIAGSHELLRPEASRFPMWRGPQFFHPALSHMHLLNSPFFPFQHRFVMPYVNQVSASQIPVTSLSSSSSESVSPRSTPSPKRGANNDVDVHHNNSLRTSRTDHRNLGTNDTPQQASEVNQDKSLSFLRSLGPEQDEPMDLSAKNATAILNSRDRESEQTSSGEELTEGRTEEGCTDDEDNDTSETETGPPLDLTRKTWRGFVDDRIRLRLDWSVKTKVNFRKFPQLTDQLPDLSETTNLFARI